MSNHTNPFLTNPTAGEQVPVAAGPPGKLEEIDCDLEGWLIVVAGIVVIFATSSNSLATSSTFVTDAEPTRNPFDAPVPSDDDLSPTQHNSQDVDMGERISLDKEELASIIRNAVDGNPSR
jgi:hypothetical protein